MIERPAAVVGLVLAQVDRELALERRLDLVQVMHHQDVFGRDGAIGLELEEPVSVGCCRAISASRAASIGCPSAELHAARLRRRDSPRTADSANWAAPRAAACDSWQRSSEPLSKLRASLHGSGARTAAGFAAPARRRAADRARRARRAGAAPGRCAPRGWSAVAGHHHRRARHFHLRAAVKPGVVWILRRVSTASPIAHRQKRRMPASSPRNQQRKGERIAQVGDAPRRSAPPCRRRSAPSLRSGESCARSTPWRLKTSCGSQQAPRLRSSQTSFRMLVICRPCANEGASS